MARDTTQITWNTATNDQLKWNVPIESVGIPIHSGETWKISGELLSREEATLFRALAKLLVDTDMYHTLMKELGLDADSALAAAFRGVK